MDVQFLGAELSPKEKQIVNDHVEKISKLVEVETLVVNIKKHDKTGERHKFSTHLRADTASGLFVSESTEWNLGLSVKEAFKKMTKELKR